MVVEKWMVHSKKADFDGFAKVLGVSPVVVRIMRNKDMDTIEAQRAFLDNSMDNLYNPSLMKDMDKAVDIIIAKIDEGKHIRVIGDYDIDGICSTYILVKGLQGVGALVSFDIPDRIVDGYGINENLIKKAYDEGVDTIVTCDNGIAAIEQIKYAKELGMTVIVTDHHEVPYVKDETSGQITYKRVQGDAVVNPKQPDCDYPFKLLCGGAIAYKVIESLYERLDVKNKREKIEYFIEYAAIATIDDVRYTPFNNTSKLASVTFGGKVDLGPLVFCYSQSEPNTELTELTFFYSNLVTVSRLQRNPTVKTEIKMRNFETSIPVGFFTYPISQAADITAFKATTVPVGEDQLPMIEQTREIVRKFNSIYDEVLVEPDVLLPDNAACCRLPGTDGKAKMSKSLNNCIYLSDTEKDVKTKIMSMYTDPNHIRIEDPGQVEGNTVFYYLDAFSKPEHFAEYLPDYANLQELKDHYSRGGLGDVKVKKFLNNVMQEELSPIRARRAEFEKDIPEIYNILKKGSDVAREKAAQTLSEVKSAMKINYFEDAELIKAQSEKYSNN